MVGVWRFAGFRVQGVFLLSVLVLLSCLCENNRLSMAIVIEAFMFMLYLACRSLCREYLTLNTWVIQGMTPNTQSCLYSPL